MKLISTEVVNLAKNGKLKICMHFVNCGGNFKLRVFEF